jgi:hypothetical protein
MAGEYTVTGYVGSMRTSVGSAVQDMTNKMATIGSGKSMHLKGIADYGPGKAWQAYAIYDT